MDGLEVFIPDLPPDLTQHGLNTHLTPIITAELGITDWVCNKYHRKTFGTVTFLHRLHGERFLARPRFFLLGQWVKCRRSKNNPDPFLLRSMLKTAEDLRIRDEDEQLPTRDKKVVFEVRSFSCGHYEYPDGNFTYTTDMEWRTGGAVDVAKFARDTLIITFNYHGSSIRVEIPYRTIHEIIVAERPTSFTLTLWEAPRFFQVIDSGNTMLLELGSLMSRMGISNRNTVQRNRLSQLPHVSGNHEAILGQSLVYRIEVSPSNFNSKLQNLKEKEKLTVSYFDFPHVLRGRTYMADGLKLFTDLLDECYKEFPVHFDVLFQFQALVQNGYLLPQTVTDLLRRLCQMMRTARTTGSSSNKANESNGNASGLSGIDGTKKHASPSFPFSVGAVKKLFSQLPFPGPDIDASTFTPDEIWSYLKANENSIRQGTAKELISERIGQNLIMVYKVQVTPTRITLLGPEPEAKNRILRKFPNHIDFFARVQFCEEDGQDLFFNTKVSFDLIWKRFKTVLLRGVHIAGRQYMFLGFSHSSLRAHGVWFMATFFDHNKHFQTYATVIADLGKFNKIYSPSRCAARIGQAFSETPFAVDLEELGVDIQYINDVKSSDGSRVFSDGVGTLSRPLMEAIQAALPRSGDTTTCFQIRWGGAKGMLALDDTLEGMVMRIRPESMVKFESDDTRYLEICDMGKKPIPLVLNRQMIKILEDMGVAEDWFIRVQNREMRRLRQITASIHNTITFLKRQKVAEQISFYKFIRRLQKLGIDYREDAFLCSIVETVVLKEVRLLKHKARIPVEKGVTLFGIMDEFGFLEEDEIYVTFEKSKLPGKNHPDLHDQLVLITRSPALHPGDIQLSRAVVPPPRHPLRSLSNCVVFSQKGKRDLPSQLSGGDLDGDIYNIIWDKGAVETSLREFLPADYPRVSPRNIGREVTREDMTDFFVEFMATDQLGVIATKHMILADRKTAGTVDDECKLLAEMHSTAVDYSKSGIPIDINKLRGLTPTKYRPEFLAPAPPAHIKDKTEIVFEAPREPSLEDDEDESGPRHHYYRSEKILGKLYRAIDEKKVWKKDIHKPVRSHGASIWEQLLLYTKKKSVELGLCNWPAVLEDARRIREAYDDAIWSATMEYSDNFTKGLTELEVFTGCIFNKSGVQTRRQRDKSVRLKDEYDRIAKWVEGLIRKKEVAPREDDEADEADDGSDSEGMSSFETQTYKGSREISHEDTFTAFELSIACLQVSIEKSNRFGRTSGDFQSFKIVAAQCALTELEIACAQHEIALGANLVAASTETRFAH
ncbi:RdRP-domain-containing protein [Hypoxylon sp. FL0890]|nr:RdRP-domain-containing protein [Hypoxylon sp. FL0890]